RRIPFLLPFGQPLLEDSQLLDGEAAFTRERAITRFRQPRRHVASRRGISNLLRVLLHVRIGQETKWCRLSRPMTGSTLLKDDRRHVLGESGRASGTGNVLPVRFGG